MADSEQSEKIQKSKIRHDWYQTDTHIFINILHKNVNQTDLKVEFQDQSVSKRKMKSFSCRLLHLMNLSIFFSHFQLNISFPTETGEDYNLKLDLSYEVVPSECSYKASPSKVEIKLKKKEGFRWIRLEGDTISKLTLKNASYGNCSRESWLKIRIKCSPLQVNIRQSVALRANHLKIGTRLLTVLQSQTNMNLLKRRLLTHFSRKYTQRVAMK